MLKLTQQDIINHVNAIIGERIQNDEPEVIQMVRMMANQGSPKSPLQPSPEQQQENSGVQYTGAGKITGGILPSQYNTQATYNTREQGLSLKQKYPFAIK